MGNRSIIANPADPKMRDKINLKIKKRPIFQPFCPSVLEEDREIIFMNSFNHKFMSTAFKMKKEFQKIFPSACHIDGTARPQFIEEEDNYALFRILKSFKKKFKYGILINTSLNIHGRTITLKPQDAIVEDFLDSDLDFLYINGYKVWKK